MMNLKYAFLLSASLLYGCSSLRDFDSVPKAREKIRNWTLKNYEEVLTELHKKTNIKIEDPPEVIIRGAIKKNEPIFGARYDFINTQTFIYIGYGYPSNNDSTFLARLNEEVSSKNNLQEILTEMITHESIHHYTHQRAAELKQPYWRTANFSEDEYVVKMWRTIVEGIAVNLSYKTTNYDIDALLLSKDSFLDMKIADRYTIFKTFPYLAGNALVRPILKEDPIKGIDAILTTIPTVEDWKDLRGYQKKVLEKLTLEYSIENY